MDEKEKAPLGEGAYTDAGNTVYDRPFINSFWADSPFTAIEDRIDRVEAKIEIGSSSEVAVLRSELAEFKASQESLNRALIARLKSTSRYPRYVEQAEAVVTIMRTSNGSVPISSFRGMVPSRSALSDMISTVIRLEPKIVIVRDSKDRRRKFLRFVR